MQIVTENVGGESYEYVPLGQYVVRAVGVCGGRPTFKYTRIEVAGILSLLAHGETVEGIVDDFDGRIPREALQEAIDIAARRLVENLPELVAA